MNQQPDKLFRDKLEHYKTPPPESAWEKIAASQIQSSNRGLWIKVAASASLVAIATYLLWPHAGSGNQQNVLAERATRTDQQDTAALATPHFHKMEAIPAPPEKKSSAPERDKSRRER